METGTIRIYRQRPLWRNILGSFRVMLDGQFVGIAARGKEVDFAVSPGRHTVQIASASPPLEVEVASGAIVNLGCRARSALGHGAQEVTGVTSGRVWSASWFDRESGTELVNSSQEPG